MDRLCEKMGRTRQAYYKQVKRRESIAVDEELVVSLVQGVRRRHPRMGGRKLYRKLKADLEDAGVKMGRDRFLALLRARGLHVPRLPGAPRTTDSRHCLPLFRNLISELEPTGPDQIWVSDITYVRLEKQFVYVALIMDLYSRKIVGHHCGDSLEASGCIKALEKALGQLPADGYPIHHSDRGCQYCCHDYVNLLRERDLPVSMTELNHCYENAHAERLNGILKQEYRLGMTFRDRAQAQRAVEEAIWLYNNERPHLSLGYRVPAEVHRAAA